MADLSDVESTLVTQIASIVYPNGTSQPSIVNTDVRIYPGYPIPANLEADLKAGKVNICVNALPGMERKTTRFDTAYQTLSVNTPTLTATVNNNTVTIGGTVSANNPQSVMVIANGKGYAYGVLNTDTPSTIAAALAALIPGAVAVGAVITIAAIYSLVARIGVTGTGIREVKRQQMVFDIRVFAPPSSPIPSTLRDSLISAIDAQLSYMVRLVLPDGYYAGIQYQGSRKDDGVQKQNCYMRSLHYQVEFATTQTETEYTITDPYCNVSAAQTGLISP